MEEEDAKKFRKPKPLPFKKLSANAATAAHMFTTVNTFAD